MKFSLDFFKITHFKFESMKFNGYKKITMENQNGKLPGSPNSLLFVKRLIFQASSAVARKIRIG